MTKKRVVLAGGLVLSLLGFAEPAIKDGSVLGYWTFDDGVQSADVSGYGGGLVQLQDGVSIESSGGYSAGYLNIAASGGKTATASLANGLSLNTDKFTIVMRMKRSSAMSKLPEVGESTDKQFVRNFNDETKWHLLTVRGKQKDAGVGASYDYGYMCDPEDFMSSSRPETASDELGFLVSVSGQNVTFGGSLKGYAYQGGIDEVMVINRMMMKEELQRLYRTGETYIFPNGNQTPSLSNSAGWSSQLENTLYLNPGDMPGAAYIIDGGWTAEQWLHVTFGGDVSKKVSLTLGRLAPLVNRLNNEILVEDTTGNIKQGPGTNFTFYDLRLNDGKITAGGYSLTTTLLDVGASSEKPFELSNAGAYSLNVGEATTGSGVLKKTGAGKLTVNAWTGTAKLRLAEGSIRTPRLDGYTGGTVLVSKGSVMAFTGSDVLPTAENKLKFAFEGDVPTTKTAVMTLPSGVTAAMVQDMTNYGGQTVLASVENGTLFVTPIATEDLGAVPVLMAE